MMALITSVCSYISSALYTNITNSIVALFSLVLSKDKTNTLKIFFKTLPRDLRCYRVALFVGVETFYQKYTNQTTITKFERQVRIRPEEPCFFFENEIWTFRDVDNYSNKVGQMFHREGFQKGDVVALMMSNRAEYACIWLGLSKLGVVTALINTNLRNQSLLHSISITNSKAIIFSNDLTPAVMEIKMALKGDVKLLQWGGKVADTEEDVLEIKESLERESTDKVSLPYKLSTKDHLVYIYTSGTTGLPKAAIMPHSRMLLIGTFTKHILQMGPADRVYNPLPMYHTAGGILALSSSILLGSSVVIRKKFSASSYFQDCIKYKCTVGQYIGEICRYLLAVPPRPDDQAHFLRMMVGNGLRPSIWKNFTDRFGIQDMMEIYGSTEGNLTFVNTERKAGAVGFIPRFLPFAHYFGAIIKIDLDTGAILRNKDGLCIPCKIGEAGMMVGVIPGKSSLKDFHGYLDHKESNNKYIYNVFRQGDKAFLSGDLLVMDEEGYIYFKDRTGDTFRWKGENVATSEVEAVISAIISFRDCTVYGVQVGELEGRVGMAAIVDPQGDLDLGQVASGLDKVLPKYAQPVFIRILSAVQMTGTYKLKKFTLQKEGFNPKTIAEAIYFRRGPTYVRLTPQLYDQILSGAISF